MADNSICSIPDCGKPKKAKGLCWAHYERLKRHGDPLGGNTREGYPLKFVHEVAIPYKGQECLIWPYSKSASGRGTVYIDSKMEYVHRYVCKKVHGEPPTPQHQAAHSCGNGHGACITPSHLGWKTHKENQADRLIHGTHSRGERHGQAKLTEDNVREIRRLRGVQSQKEIASFFGVSSQTISDIHRGLKWSWLPTI